MTNQAEQWVEAWLAFQKTPEDTVEWWERREDALAFAELCVNDPETAWAAIVDIVRREPDEEILAVLAAWPLEDLLSHHGEAFINRAEAAAQQDPRFRRVLAGTWRADMTQDVWKRVLAASRRDSANGVRRWNRESFLRAACDVMTNELDWDSLDSGCLHFATSPGRMLDGTPVVVGVLDRLDVIAEVLEDAEETRRGEGAERNGAPLWLYAPEGLDVGELAAVVRRVDLRDIVE